MEATDHMLKPSENTLHQRGHPHRNHADRSASSQSMGPDPKLANDYPFACIFIGLEAVREFEYEVFTYRVPTAHRLHK